MTQVNVQAASIRVLGTIHNSYEKILSPEALRFIAFLHEQFEPRRQELIQARSQRQKALEEGQLPDFPTETKYIRESYWKVGPIPADLEDRRVEITGPVDRKMVINALNSGAKCFMADFEDSTAPTWSNQVEGQINLYDAVRKTITYHQPETGKQYKLNEKTATLLVRPRGWHLDEAHILINNQIVSGSLFDFGLYFFHNAHQLLVRGSGPYFYLPKLEHYLEARLWNDVFIASQAYLSIPRGLIRATVLIETIVAVFQMDEILFELREHSAGLNCGRWDYIFSYIKKFRNNPKFVLPDRSHVGMTAPFMAAYVDLLVQTCHKRGIHAMGGMAAQIPVRNDTEKNKQFLEAVRIDKMREVEAGHDGTWVAHPGLVSIATDIFDQHMKGKNQITNIPMNKTEITQDLLLKAPSGPRTLDGLVDNIDIVLVYCEAWLRGIGCIPFNYKMEDAATAEISRAQVWQWIRHSCSLDDGQTVTKEFVQDILRKCIEKRAHDAVAGNKYDIAGDIVGRLLTSDDMAEFLTIPCYMHIINFQSMI